MENPCVVGIAGRRNAITFPAGGRLKFSILGIFLQIEWRICHDVVEFEVFMLVVGEGRYRFVSQMVGYTANSQIHLCQTIGRRFGFLPIHVDRFGVTAMCFNELGCLHEHTA